MGYKFSNEMMIKMIYALYQITHDEQLNYRTTHKVLVTFPCISFGKVLHPTIVLHKDLSLALLTDRLIDCRICPHTNTALDNQIY